MGNKEDGRDIYYYKNIAKAFTPVYRFIAKQYILMDMGETASPVVRDDGIFHQVTLLLKPGGNSNS